MQVRSSMQFIVLMRHQTAPVAKKILFIASIVTWISCMWPFTKYIRLCYYLRTPSLQASVN